MSAATEETAAPAAEDAAAALEQLQLAEPEAEGLSDAQLPPELPSTLPPPAAEAAEAFFYQFAMSLLPPQQLQMRDEAIRQRLEAAVRCRDGWGDARVAIYGSAGSTLRVGTSSDVDLCVQLGGQHAAQCEHVQQVARVAAEQLAAAEAQYPDAVRSLAESAAVEKTSRLAAADLDAQLKKTGRLERAREDLQARLEEATLGSAERLAALAAAKEPAAPGAEEAPLGGAAGGGAAPAEAAAEGADGELSPTAAHAAAFAEAERGRLAALQTSLDELLLEIDETREKAATQRAAFSEAEARAKAARVRAAAAAAGGSDVRLGEQTVLAAQKAVLAARDLDDNTKRIVHPLGTALSWAG